MFSIGPTSERACETTAMWFQPETMIIAPPKTQAWFGFGDSGEGKGGVVATVDIDAALEGKALVVVVVDVNLTVVDIVGRIDQDAVGGAVGRTCAHPRDEAAVLETEHRKPDRLHGIENGIIGAKDSDQVPARPR